MNARLAIVGVFARCVIVCLSAGLTLSAASAAFGQAPPKIGVVNFQEVALGSKAGKARLEKLAEKLKKEVKGEEAKLLARQKDLEASASRLAEIVRRFDRASK